MKLIIVFCLLFTLSNTQYLQAQSEMELISETLMNYIEGTANGEPKRIAEAFHPDLVLYSVAGDSLRAWHGKDYISLFKEGEKTNRVGKIISIDYVNNAASAKVEIVMPGSPKVYTDYFLLLKYKGSWKIIHKSYTSIQYSD